MLPTKINNVDVEYVYITDQMHYSGESIGGEKRDDFVNALGWNGDYVLLFFEFDEEGNALSLNRQRKGEKAVYPQDSWIVREIIKAHDDFSKENPNIYPFKIYVFYSSKRPNSVAINVSTGQLRIVKYIQKVFHFSGIFE